jgi:hypothetical protein
MIAFVVLSVSLAAAASAVSTRHISTGRGGLLLSPTKRVKTTRRPLFTCCLFNDAPCISGYTHTASNGRMTGE